MAYNKRTVAKLDRWYKYCSFKPIHIVVLENVYNGLWREKGYRRTAAAIRRERDAAWWERMRGIAARK